MLAYCFTNSIIYINGRYFSYVVRSIELQPFTVKSFVRIPIAKFAEMFLKVPDYPVIEAPLFVRTQVTK